MDGRNSTDMRRATHYLLLLFVMTLLSIIVNGCIPVIDVNGWPVPNSYRQYLPPNEKDDVLLIGVYHYSNKQNAVAEDVQVLTYPYDKATLKSTSSLGITSVAWGIGYRCERIQILLFTKKRQAICIPLRPFGAFDDALSYYYVMNNPPLTAEHFLSASKTSFPFFHCIGSPGYFPKVCLGPDVQYCWKTLEDAERARKFWEERSPAFSPSSLSIWELHSIYGETDQFLSERE